MKKGVSLPAFVYVVIVLLGIAIAVLFNPSITGLQSYAPTAYISLIEYFPEADENTTFSASSNDGMVTIKGIVAIVVGNSLLTKQATLEITASSKMQSTKTIVISLIKPQKKKIDDYVMQELSQQGYSRVIVKLKKIDGLKAEQQEFRIDAIKQELLEKEDIAEEWEFDSAIELSEGFAGYITQKGVEKLQQHPDVGEIIIDKPVSAFIQDTRKITGAEYTHKIEIQNANITGTGAVCIIDTGIDYTHPSLGGCFGDNCKVIAGYNFCANNDCTEQSSDPLDDHGHGTHVAGIVASEGQNKGMAPTAKLAAVKGLNKQGAGYYSTVQASIEWCRNNAQTYNITIISMSLGDGGSYTQESCPKALDESINNASNSGLFITAASGNNYNKNGISYPACQENITSVGATDKSDNIASYSNSGTALDLLAPGSSINSTDKNNGFRIRSGTSMATPHVAGVVSLIKHYLSVSNKNMTNKEILALLQTTGKKLQDSNGLSTARINALSALLQLHKNINIDNGKITHSKGKIEYSTLQDSTGIDKCIFFNDKKIRINSSQCNNLNLSAAITINAFGFSGAIPRFSYDEINYTACTETTDPSCTNASYNQDNLTFTASHFTTFEAFEADTTLPKVLLNISPAEGKGGFIITANVTDNSDISAVFANITFANETLQLLQLQNITSLFTATVTSFNNGINNVTIIANDSSNNINSTVSASFVVKDIQPPSVILSITPSTTTAGNFTISAIVNDDTAISTVIANITFANSSSAEIILQNTSNNYSGTIHSASIGQNNVLIIANDSSNNINATTRGGFFVTATQLTILFASITPLSAITGTTFNLSANATSQPDIDSVMANITLPNGSSIVVTMQNNTGTFTANFTATTIGEYSARFIVNDTAGNTNNTISVSFSTTQQDNEPPYINSRTINPASASQNTVFDISANVTDSQIVSQVLANITFPNGTGLLLALKNQSDQYSTNFTPSIIDIHGIYTTRIIANDTSNNKNTSELDSFSVTDTTLPSVTATTEPSSGQRTTQFIITAAVTDNINDNSRVSTVVSNITIPNKTTMILIMSNGSGNTYNVTYSPSTNATTGQYNVTIIANDTSNNINNSITTQFTISYSQIILQPTPTSGTQGGGGGGSSSEKRGKSPAPPSQSYAPSASISPIIAVQPSQAKAVEQPKPKTVQDKKPTELNISVPVNVIKEKNIFCDSQQRMLRAIAVFAILVAAVSLMRTTKKQKSFPLISGIIVGLSFIVAITYHSSCKTTPFVIYSMLAMAAILVVSNAILKWNK